MDIGRRAINFSKALVFVCLECFSSASSSSSVKSSTFHCRYTDVVSPFFFGISIINIFYLKIK